MGGLARRDGTSFVPALNTVACELLDADSLRILDRSGHHIPTDRSHFLRRSMLDRSHVTAAPSCCIRGR